MRQTKSGHMKYKRCTASGRQSNKLWILLSRPQMRYLFSPQFLFPLSSLPYFPLTPSPFLAPSLYLSSSHSLSHARKHTQLCHQLVKHTVRYSQSQRSNFPSAVLTYIYPLYTTTHDITLHYITQNTTPYQYIPHHTTSHQITLHYTTLHHTTHSLIPRICPHATAPHRWQKLLVSYPLPDPRIYSAVYYGTGKFSAVQ